MLLIGSNGTSDQVDLETHIVSHILFSVDLMTFEISLLVNFSCELGPIMTRYDYYGPDE